MSVLSRVYYWIRNREPVAVIAAVEAVILVLVAFGLNVTPEQMAAIMGAVMAVGAVFARDAVFSRHTYARDMEAQHLRSGV